MATAATPPGPPEPPSPPAAHTHPHPEEQKRGQERLCRVIALSGGPSLDARPPYPVVENPFWYRAVYALATDAAHFGDPDTAVARAMLLAGVLETTLASRWPLFPRSHRRRRRALCGFLRELEPAALVMLAGVENRHKAPSHLRDSAVLAHLRKGKPVAPERLVAFVERFEGPVSPRAEYNLACFHAEHGDLAAAIGHLRYGLPLLEPPMLEWAMKDPSLEPVRDAVLEIVGEQMQPAAGDEATAARPRTRHFTI